MGLIGLFRILTGKRKQQIPLIAQPQPFPSKMIEELEPAQVYHKEAMAEYDRIIEGLRNSKDAEESFRLIDELGYANSMIYKSFSARSIEEIRKMHTDGTIPASSQALIDEQLDTWLELGVAGSDSN